MTERRYKPRPEYFPTPINPWSFLRTLIPIRQSLENPLVVYQIRRSYQTGRKPWVLLMVAYGVILLQILYLVGLITLEEVDNIRFNEMLNTMLGIMVGIMILGAVYGHWRLMLAIFLRVGRTVTERRQNGDWELISITPMPKARWLQAQLVAMGWQIWPLLRNLILLQALLVVILYGFSVTQMSNFFDNDSLYQDYDDALPLPVYTVVVLPMLVGLVVEPILFVGLVTAVAFYVSTLTKQPAFALLYSFFGLFLARSIIAAVFFYSGVFFTIFFFSFSSESDMGSLSAEGFFGFLLYSCIAIPIYSFFIETLPPFAPILMGVEADLWEQILLYMVIMCTGVTTYIVTPLLIIRTLTDSTISRLQRRER